MLLNNMEKIKKFWFLLIATGLVIPLLAAAQCSGDDIGLCSAAGLFIPTGVPEPVAIIGTVIRLVLSVVGVIFLIMILYAGYNWMTAAGKEEQIRMAKRTIAHGAIALVIILGSYIIVNFVLSSLQKATL